MPSAHRALGLALVLFAATACGGGGESARPQAAPTGAATATPDGLERAPDFTLEKLDGGTFTLSEHLGELPVVLNFWAPWWLQCRAEQPGLGQVARDFEDEVLFFGVAWHGSEQDCRDYVEEFDVPYDNALDRDDAVFADFGINHQPATVLITPSGGIYRKHAGPIGREELSALIEELLEA